MTAEDGTGSAMRDGDGDGDGDSNSSSSSGDGDLDCAPDAECRAMPTDGSASSPSQICRTLIGRAARVLGSPLERAGLERPKYQLLADPLDADCACECEALLDETNGPACEEFGRRSPRRLYRRGDMPVGRWTPAVLR